METCVRGFSYMPKNKIGPENMQYVESSELEGTWKTTRRQRIKQQEQKIWDDFLKENDIVNKVCEDDPYQFLSEIPESQLQQLMDIELRKMTDEKHKDDVQKEIPEEVQETPKHDVQRVTFVNEVSIDDDDDDVIFHIFDDDEDAVVTTEPMVAESDDDDQCTVRERDMDNGDMQSNDGRIEGKSFEENAYNAIETSIYCVKIRDLRVKINQQIQSMITSLETLDLRQTDPEELRKMRKRSSEFCSRFNRIYTYQLQRQVHAIERAASLSCPFGSRTHAQRQAARAAAVHEHAAQALQVFHKSFDQTGCILDCGEMLRSLLTYLRTITTICAEVMASKQLGSAKGLYNDDMLDYCDSLEVALNDYTTRTADLVNEEDSSKSKKGRGRRITSSKGSKAGSDAKLSMYSLDAKSNLHPRRSKIIQPSTSRLLGTLNQQKNQKVDPKEDSKKKVKISSARRVSMREAAAAGAARDTDVSTAVEGVHVNMCESMSREHSPTNLLKSVKPTHGKKKHIAHPDGTPRGHIKTKTIVEKNEDPTPLSGRSEVEALLMSAFRKDESKVDSVKNSEISNDERLECGSDKMTDSSRGGCDVTMLLRRLCGEAKISSSGKRERVCGAKNAQLHCISGDSPRPPTTPQLLRILEETIQKKSPRSYSEKSSKSNAERHRLTFNLSEGVVTGILQYRTWFVQHMLSSSMYANSTVGKPWEMINRISENIIDDTLLECMKSMKIRDLKQLKPIKS